MNYIIENLKINELKECAPLLVKAYSKAPYNEKWNKEYALERINEVFKGNEDYCLCVKENNKIVGFILGRQYTWEDGKRIFVEDLVVDENFRGNLGSKLLNSLNNIAKKNNINSFNAIVNKLSRAYPYLRYLGFNSTEYEYLEWKVK